MDQKEKMLAEVVIKKRYITQIQLDRATKIKELAPMKELGGIFTELGFITPNELTILKREVTNLLRMSSRTIQKDYSEPIEVKPISLENQENQRTEVNQFSNTSKSVEQNVKLDFDADTQSDAAVNAYLKDVNDSENLVGKEFVGCKILELIGEGGMGRIYKAQHMFLNKLMAMKLLPYQFTKNKQHVDRFLREAKSAAKLEHPNIVKIYDVGSAQNQFYMLMQFVNGKDVKQIIKKQQKLTIADSIYIVQEVAKALVEAHKHKIIHRDIKPDNIMIEGNKILVTDFGLAKLEMTDGVREDLEITSPGQILGSPFFMSPEQADENGKVDSRTDIYSLGATFYFLVTGKYPFNANNPLAIIFKHISEPLTPPIKINPEIPKPINDLIIKMMEKNKLKRIQSAKILLQHLERIKVDNVSSFEGFDLISKLTINEKNGIFGQEESKQNKEPSDLILDSFDNTRTHTKSITQSQEKTKLIGVNEQEKSQKLSSTDQAIHDSLITEIADLLKENDFEAAKSLIAKGLMQFPFSENLISMRNSLPDIENKEIIKNSIKNARELLKDGEAALAERELLKVVSIDSKNSVALGLIEEIKTLRSKLEPSIELGLKKIEKKEFTDSLKIFQAILKIDPENRIANIQKNQIKSRIAQAKENYDKAVKLCKSGEIQKAYEHVKEGLILIPGKPQLIELQDKIEQREQEVQKILHTAQQNANKGNLTKAINISQKCLKIIKNHQKALSLISQWQDKQKLFEGYMNKAKNSLDNKDFVKARVHLSEAQIMKPDNEFIQTNLNKISPILIEFNRLIDEGKEYYAKAEIQKAIEIWEQAREICPGDEDINNLIVDASDHKMKIDKLKTLAENAEQKNNFDLARKYFKQLKIKEPALTWIPDKLNQLSVLKARKKRAKFFLRLIIFIFVLGGAGIGGYFYVTSTNADNLKQITELLNEAEISDDPHPIFEKSANLMSNFILDGFGLENGKIEELQTRIENGNFLINAKNFEKIGKFAEAKEIWQKIGKNDECKRLDKIIVVRKFNSLLKTFVKQVNAVRKYDFDKIFKNQADPSIFVKKADKVLEIYAELQQIKSEFGKNEIADTNTNFDQVPVLNEIKATDAKFATELQAELSIFNKITHEIDNLATLKANIFTGTENKAGDNFYTEIETELSAISDLLEDSTWKKKYEFVNNIIKNLQIMIPLMSEWFDGWTNYKNAQEELNKCNQKDKATLAETLENFEKTQQIFVSARATLVKLSEIDNFEYSEMLKTIKTSLDKVSESISNVLLTLKRFKNVDVSFVAMNKNHRFFLFNAPLTQKDYADFIDGGGYENSEYWKQWAIERNYLEMLGNEEWLKIALGLEFKSKDEVKHKPYFGCDGSKNETLIGVSWFEVQAYLYWLKEQESIDKIYVGARLPKEDELIFALKNKLISVKQFILDDGTYAPLIEWTDTQEKVNDIMEGVLVTGGNSVEKQQKPLGFRDKYIGFRILIPFQDVFVDCPDITGF